jgi:hypothetical protein
MTSDEFFKQNKLIFDVIFIDGLHNADQVYRDIINSIRMCSHKGYIVCHDMNPEKEEIQLTTKPKKGQEWTGDCWKAWVKLRQKRWNLKMYVVDTDYGCGIIQAGTQELINVESELTYENLNKNRKYWLNLITVNEKYVHIAR